MSRSYTKQDVQQHVTGYAGPALPAVNVKTEPWNVNYRVWSAAAASGYNPDAFVEWAEAQSDDFWTGYFEFACESGWEMIQQDAEEIFGSHVKVWSEGRSGGWAVVDGLPDLENWDAVILSKWRKFERYARAVADGIPYDMAVLAAINSYQAELDRKHQCEQEWTRELLASIA